MKAVVLEIRDGLAAVLREDGTVEKIRRDCRVGETIELEDRGKVVRLPQKATRWAVAAAAALVILSAGGSYGYNNAYAYSYVTLDANPSIEYVLNRRNRVISVEALNEDGEALAARLEEAGVKNESLTYAMAAATDILYEEDYLGEERDNCLLVNVSSRGEAQKNTLTQEVDAYFAARAEGEDIDLYMTNATKDEVRRAEDLGMSPGRYVLIRDIEENEGPMSEEDIGRMGGEPVGDLLTQSGRRAPRAEETPAGAPDTAATAEPDQSPAGRDSLPGSGPTGEPQGAPEAGITEDAPEGGPNSVPEQGQAGLPDGQSGGPGGNESPSGEPSA